MNRVFARVTGAALGAVAITGLAAPAQAAPPLPSAVHASFRYVHVTYVIEANCAAVLGTAQSFDETTYVVRAWADAVGPSPTLSTVVRCVVYDGRTGIPIEVVAGGLPGSHAEVVDHEVVVSSDADVKLCVEGGANWLNGHGVAPSGHCPR